MAKAQAMSGREIVAEFAHAAWSHPTIARFRGGVVASVGLAALLALASYPLLIEPFTALADQSQGWSVGYALLAAILLFSGWSIVQAANIDPG